MSINRVFRASRAALLVSSAILIPAQLAAQETQESSEDSVVLSDDGMILTGTPIRDSQ